MHSFHEWKHQDVYSVQVKTHSDDVILSEAQFVVIVSLEIQQSLCPSPPVTGNNKEVFMVSLVALHGVVRSQVLERQGGTSGNRHLY